MSITLHTGDTDVIRSVDIETDDGDIVLFDLIEEQDVPVVRTILSWSVDDTETVAYALLAIVASERARDVRQWRLL